MLLRFAATNYLSIRDRAELSFVAAPLKELSEVLIDSPFVRHGVLPVLALYGANASGKSNLLHALARLRSLVVGSFQRKSDDAELPFRPFKLDDESADRPTELELDFVLDGVRYQFGVNYNSRAITKEWLYRFPKSHQQVLYYREPDSGESIYFGRSLTGSLKQIESITAPRVLFLSVAQKSAHPLLSEIFDYFRSGIRVELNNGHMPGQAIAEHLKDNQDLQRTVAQHIALVDTGIADIKIETKALPEQERAMFGELVRAVSKAAGAEEPFDVPETQSNILLGHTGVGGAVRYIEFGQESLGTRYLLTLLPPMIDALQCGGVLVLDEITTGLHTLLAKHLIGLFNSKATNPKGAQLLFTTHDTNLLNQDLLRRDEIWFVEKSRDGASSVLPLSDLKTKNTDNIERGYLQGRFGGVPYIGK